MSNEYIKLLCGICRTNYIYLSAKATSISLNASLICSYFFFMDWGENLKKKRYVGYQNHQHF